MMSRLVGAAMVVVGLLLRRASHRVLREAGVTAVEFSFLRPPPRYLHDQPYKWFDHPAYAGSLLIYGGAGMLCLGWGGIAIAFSMWPFYEDRIRIEDYNRQRARELGVDGA